MQNKSPFTSFLLPVLFLAGISLLNAAQPRRSVRVEGTATASGKITVVIQESAPLLQFAGEEIQRLLGKATGQNIAVTTEPASEGISLILGNCALARQAGIRTESLPEQAYIIRRQNKWIYLAGRDSPTNHPARNSWGQYYPRATLSAVYDFLERFAGIRFFFPGEIGTVIPRQQNLKLPAVIDILEMPDYAERTTYVGSPKWYEKNDKYHGISGHNLNLLRLRMGEFYTPFCHGLIYMNYPERFKNHPEYFALMDNGKRYVGKNLIHSGHLCFNSGIREEIFQDAKAYLTGKPASSRDLKHWSINVANHGCFCVMPQDWLYFCHCDQCRKIARGGRHYEDWTSQERQAISNHVWGMAAEVAGRLKKEGIPGNITLLAYAPYEKTPQFALPDNIMVEVAATGPWASDSENKVEDATITSWSQKMKRPVILWTYPGKHMQKAELVGIPSLTPRAIGKYHQDRRAIVKGAFMEAEVDQYIFHYLNYYVYAKVAWNLSTDLDALLADHYRAMFGKGAGPMQNFYERLEELWLKGALRKNIGTAAAAGGAKIASAIELWTKIYSPAELQRMEKYFKDARRLAASEPESLKRIDFMREKLLMPLYAEYARFRKEQEAVDNWSVNLPGKIGLRSNLGDINEVETLVEIRETPEHFVFQFTCQEPRMSDLIAKYKEFDQPKIFADSCVELFLNPSGDRKNYYHLIVNANGALRDAACIVNGKTDLGWNSGTKVTSRKNKDSWQTEISIPKKALGNYNPKGFPVNFARNRALNGTPARIPYYQWSPIPGRGFHNVERYGILKLQKEKNNNLIQDNDFDCIRKNKYRAGKWMLWHSEKESTGQTIELDRRIFMTAGQSLHLRNIKGGRMNAAQYLQGIKPNTKYRLSFFIRTSNIKAAEGPGAGAYIFINSRTQFALPRTRLTESNPWHRLSFEFNSGDFSSEDKPSLALWIWGASGDAWYDHIRLEQVK